MARVTPSEALQRLFSATLQGMHLAPSKEQERIDLVGRCTDYVYLFRRGKGGLVLPSDDEVMPVLGECENGDFFDDEIPDALTYLMSGFGDEIEYYQNNRLVTDDDSPESGAAEEQRKNVAAMCKATWGQGSPYNDLIVFDGEKCVTGCWATAVAIIMQYWGTKGYHRGCTPTTKYHYSDGWTNNEPLPSITVFDYRNLVPTKPKTEAEIKAVATMMKYIGYACKLKYSKDLTVVSGSIATPYLKSALRLGNAISHISSAKLGNDRYEKAIYNEIIQGRPCIINGFNESGGGGHFFVADGYRTDGKYHINWGWGSYNGYFALNALKPAQSREYSYNRFATIGICPDYALGDVNSDGRVNITDVMVLLEKAQNGEFSEIADINADGKVNVADMQIIINYILGKTSL